MTQPKTRNRILFTLYLLLLAVIAAWNLLTYFSSYRYGIGVDIDEAENKLTITEFMSWDDSQMPLLVKGDLIKSLNGTDLDASFSSISSFFLTMRKEAEVNLGILRDNQQLNVHIAGQQPQLNFLWFAGFFSAAFATIIGCWIFYARPLNLAAALIGLTFATSGMTINSGFARFVVVTPFEFLLGRTDLLFESFALAMLLHFSYIFPRPKKFSENRLVVFLTYACAPIPAFLLLGELMLDSINKNPDFYFGDFSFVVNILLFVYAIYLGITVVFLIHSYFSSQNKAERKRIRWILLGSAAVLLYSLIHLIVVNILRWQWPLPIWLHAFLFLILPISFLYSIVRYRAMEIQIMIRKGIVYSLLTGIVLLFAAGTFFVLFRLPDLLMGLISPSEEAGRGFWDITFLSGREWFLVIWALLVGMFIKWIKDFAQAFVDKYFYRERYNYKQAMKGFADVLLRENDRERIIQLMKENINKFVHPRSAVAALLEETGRIEVIHLFGEVEHGDLDQEDLSRLFKAFPPQLFYLGVSELQGDAVDESEELLSLFERLKADISFPLRTERGDVGYVFFGPKLSEVAYNTEDIEMLQLLVGQVAVGLERLRLTEEVAKKRMIERELEIGREIQRSLLPATIPEVEGLDIFAMNVSAMEVGGDFYSFVHYDKSQLGIIVGDIIGKGVAGAMSMSAAINLMNYIAETSKTTAEALNKLNNHLLRSKSGRSFAAVLFAVIDVAGHHLTWCNSGLPEPILISRGKKPRFVESKSYPLPPGSSGRSIYHEEQLDLEAGDRLVFVTDGAVEVRSDNGSREEFGYNKLLNFFNDQYERTPRELLQSLLAELQQFHGKGSLDDDFTAVAISLER